MIFRIEIVGSFEPLDRGERFDIPLIEYLEPIGGDILDSGSFLSDGNIAYSEIEIELPDTEPLDTVLDILTAGGVPISSSVAAYHEKNDAWEVVHTF